MKYVNRKTGNVYILKGFANSAEDESVMAIYEEADTGLQWVTPRKQFMENFEKLTRMPLFGGKKK